MKSPKLLIVFLSLFLFSGHVLADLESEITTNLEYFEELWKERDLESIRAHRTAALERGSSVRPT